jgi:hypothetical protein
VLLCFLPRPWDTVDEEVYLVERRTHDYRWKVHHPAALRKSSQRQAASSRRGR